MRLPCPPLPENSEDLRPVVGPPHLGGDLFDPGQVPQPVLLMPGERPAAGFQLGEDEPPATDSPEWKKWILAELGRRKYEELVLDRLPAAAAETIGMFRLAAELRTKVDREAFASFILSMTHSVADVLGAYLLAKEGGLFSDAAGIDRCVLPIVPLFETIADLRRAPQDVRELLSVPLVRRSVWEHDVLSRDRGRGVVDSRP